jgi:hypothetical protein
MPVRMSAALAALLAAVLLSPASAQDQPDGFRSPSGNVHCQAFKLDDGAALRCDIRQMSNKPPARPRDCELDWGQAFEVSGKAQPAARLCHGDTVMDEQLPPLAMARHGSGTASRAARSRVG